MSENRGFQLSLLLCYSRITGSSTTSYLLSPHSNNQYELKKQTVQLLFEKETAKTPMVYGLWRWLIPQHNLIPKQLQQHQNPHTKERPNTKSGALLSTWFYKADMTAEIALPSYHKAQLPIFFKRFHGELNGKENRLQGSMVQMWVLVHQICYCSLIQEEN